MVVVHARETDWFVEPIDVSDAQNRFKLLSEEIAEIDKVVARDKKSQSPSRVAARQRLLTRREELDTEAKYLRHWLKPDVQWPPPLRVVALPPPPPPTSPTPAPKPVKAKKPPPPPTPPKAPKPIAQMKSKAQLIRERFELGLKIQAAKRAGKQLTSEEETTLAELSYLWCCENPQPLLYEVYIRGLTDGDFGIWSALQLALVTRKPEHYALANDRRERMRLKRQQQPVPQGLSLDYLLINLLCDDHEGAIRYLRTFGPSERYRAFGWLLIGLYMAIPKVVEVARDMAKKHDGPARAWFFVKAYALTGSKEDRDLMLQNQDAPADAKGGVEVFRTRQVRALCCHGEFEHARETLKNIQDPKLKLRCIALIAAFTQMTEDIDAVELALSMIPVRDSDTLIWVAKALMSERLGQLKKILAQDDLDWKLKCAGYCRVARAYQDASMLKMAVLTESRMRNEGSASANLVRLEIMRAQLEFGMLHEAKEMATGITMSDQRATAAVMLYAHTLRLSASDMAGKVWISD